MPLLSIRNLESGIDVWRSKDWPSDFNNAFYNELEQLRVGGLGHEWWVAIVDHLWTWRAIRPWSKARIRERGLAVLDHLAAEFQRVGDSAEPSRLNFESVSWQSLSGLFRVARSIKDDSVVFGSKLCHFVFPNLFPVIDREVIGLTDYESYWSYCQNQWVACPRKQRLIEELAARINAEVPPEFPWGTKITELCIMGQRARAEIGRRR